MVTGNIENFLKVKNESMGGQMLAHRRDGGGGVSGWAMFWLFMIVLFIGDTFVHLKGYDTFWWKYKTDAEKEIQKIKIEKMRGS